MSKKAIKIETVDNPALILHAKTLPNHGTLKISDRGLVYLDIDNRFIKDLWPMIDEPGVEPRDYISEGIGSHISTIYPEENDSPKFDPGMAATFEITHLVRAETIDKVYYALYVRSPALMQVRYDNNLGDKLVLEEFEVDLHTSIAHKVLEG